MYSLSFVESTPTGHGASSVERSAPVARGVVSVTTRQATGCPRRPGPAGTATRSGRASPGPEPGDDEPSDCEHDRADHDPLEDLGVALDDVPVATEEEAGHDEHRVPDAAAEPGEQHELPGRQLRRARGQRDEAAEDRHEPSEEDRLPAVPAEPVRRRVEVALVEQRDLRDDPARAVLAEPAREPVHDEGPDERADGRPD